MALDPSLVKAFASITNDATSDSSSKSALYGTVIGFNTDGQTLVVIDGSSVQTIATSAIACKVNDRVVVTIEDHKAVVTANVTEPASAGFEAPELVSIAVDEHGDPIMKLNIETGHVVFKSIDILDTLASQYIVTDALNAGSAVIKNLVANSLDVHSINGNVIKDSRLLAKVFSNEVIESLLGVNVYYQALEPPTGEEGDIWFQTITVDDEPQEILHEYQDGEWVNVDFDFRTLRAKSIVAADINVKDLAALGATIGSWEISEHGIESDYYSENRKNRYQCKLLNSPSDYFWLRCQETLWSDPDDPTSVLMDRLMKIGQSDLYYQKVTEDYTNSSDLSSDDFELLHVVDDLTQNRLYCSYDQIELTDYSRARTKQLFMTCNSVGIYDNVAGNHSYLDSTKLETTTVDASSIIGKTFKVDGHTSNIGSGLPSSSISLTQTGTCTNSGTRYRAGYMDLPAGTWLISAQVRFTKKASSAAGITVSSSDSNNYRMYDRRENGIAGATPQVHNVVTVTSTTRYYIWAIASAGAPVSWSAVTANAERLL